MTAKFLRTCSGARRRRTIRRAGGRALRVQTNPGGDAGGEHLRERSIARTTRETSAELRGGSLVKRQFEPGVPCKSKRRKNRDDQMSELCLSLTTPRSTRAGAQQFKGGESVDCRHGHKLSKSDSAPSAARARWPMAQQAGALRYDGREGQKRLKKRLHKRQTTHYKSAYEYGSPLYFIRRPSRMCFGKLAAK